MKFKKLLAAVTAAACATCINFAGGGQQQLVVNAETYSGSLTYGDYLSYYQIDENEDGTYDYIEIDDCDMSVTEIEIPVEIDGLPVKSIGFHAFYDCSSITSITIPNSITNIGGEAFYNCSSLTSVTLPDSVTNIDNDVFYNTPFLNNQTGVKYAGKWVVDCDEDVTTAEIKDGTIGIADCAFEDCTYLTSIAVPNSVTSIGNSAFSECASLESIIIPDSVTSIGNMAFIFCTNLESIIIPDSVTSIGWDAFEDTALLNNQTGVKYAGKWVVDCDEDVTTAEIKEGTIGIADGAFEDCTYLTSIAVPNSVTSIGNSAFLDCSGLTSISIPNSLTSIENNVFSGCSSLTSITIPDGVTSIGESAFEDCTSLLSITIPDSVIRIEEDAFFNCTTLKNIIIKNPECEIYDSPLTICNGYEIRVSDDVYIGIFSGTIYGCENSTAQVYAEKYGYSFVAVSEDGPYLTNDGFLTYYQVDEEEDGTYDYIEITDCDESATEIEIPVEIDGLPVKSIGKGAFEDCTYLTSIAVPNSVTSIGERAFLGCSSLTSISIPNSLTSIENNVFLGCSSLTSITIPDGVTSIGESAFEGCTSLLSITIPDNVISVETSAFNDCKSLENITVSDENKNYADVDGVLFNKDLTKIITYPKAKSDAEYIILDSVTNIEYTFGYCLNLTSVFISNSVTSIGEAAFFNCENLTNVSIPNSVTSIGNMAFIFCTSLESITIPDSVTSIGEYAFYGCENLKSITVENPECEIYDEECTICNYDDGEVFKSFFTGTIYGHENSTAQAYAEKYGYNFAVIEDDEPTDPTEPTESTEITTLTTGGDSSDTATNTTAVTDLIDTVTNTKVSDVTTQTAVTTDVMTTDTTGTIDPSKIKGDSNGDGKLNVRDAANIASMLAKSKGDELPPEADFNGDGKINVRDAAAIATFLAGGKPSTAPAEPTTDPTESAATNWQAAYAEILRDYIASPDKARDSAKFSLCYVDDDNIPELVVHAVAGTAHVDTEVYLYTFYNGEVRDLGERCNGGYSNFTYYEKTGIVITGWTNQGVGNESMCRLSNGEISLEHTYFSNKAAVADGYSTFDDVVCDDALEKYRACLPSVKATTENGNYSLTEENILSVLTD